MPKARLDSPSYRPASSAMVPRRCTCGGCFECIDNARWERIFQAKFADPDYYNRGINLRQSSPLS
jgi:hypothetical protein